MMVLRLRVVIQVIADRCDAGAIAVTMMMMIVMIVVAQGATTTGAGYQAILIDTSAIGQEICVRWCA